MKSVRVSVVIPAYNEEKLLGRCLESLKNQAIQPYEVIVVDNNSSDATTDIANQYGATVIQEAKQGMMWARDAGFNTATGDIVARIDADCSVPPEWIQIITDYYAGQNLPVEACSGVTGMGYYATRPILLGKIYGTIMSTGLHIGNRLLLGNVALYGSCMAFPLGWWDSVKDEVCHDSDAVHEDVDLSAHLLEKGHRILRLPGFYSFIDTRTMTESPKKTLWRWRIWPESARRHRRGGGSSTR